MTAPGRNIYSTMSLNMKYACGAVGHLTSSYDITRGHPMERCEVAGVNGRLVFEDMWREATLYPAGNPVKEVYIIPFSADLKAFTTPSTTVSPASWPRSATARAPRRSTAPVRRAWRPPARPAFP